MNQLTNRFGRFVPIGVQRCSSFCSLRDPSLILNNFQGLRHLSTTTAVFHSTTETTLRVFSTSLKQQQQIKQKTCPQMFRSFTSQEQMMSSSTTTEPSMAIVDDVPFPQNKPISEMSNEELADTSTIPGWELIHSPPKQLPRGALIGTVVSDKMDKTVNVAVVRYRLVPKIRKRIKYTRKFMAHDEREVANMGDVVMITPCHRISKNKHFMLREIVRGKGQL